MKVRFEVCRMDNRIKFPTVTRENTCNHEQIKNIKTAMSNDIKFMGKGVGLLVCLFPLFLTLFDLGIV